MTIETTDPAELTEQINNYLEETGKSRLSPKIVAELRALGYKRCPKCRTVLSTDAFNISRSNRDGLTGRCRACCNADNAAWREANAEYDRERTLAWYAENREREIQRMAQRRAEDPWKGRLYSGYKRAEAAGLPADRITTEELLESWEQRGIDPECSIYSGKPLTPETLSLDHLVPLCHPESPGHVVTNLVPCLLRENETKSKRHWIYLLTNEIPEDAPEHVRELLEVAQ